MAYTLALYLDGIGGRAQNTLTFTGSEAVDVSTTVAVSPGTYTIDVPAPASVSFIYILASGALTVTGSDLNFVEFDLVAAQPLIWSASLCPGWDLFGPGAAAQTLTFANAAAAEVTLIVKIVLDGTPA